MKKQKAGSNKSITLDHVANIVGRGFQEVRAELKEGFKKVDERFDRVESRLTVVEQKIDLVRTDITDLRFDHKKMLARIENLELKAFGSVQD
jgi:septation ring formation regulator EzrA